MSTKVNRHIKTVPDKYIKDLWVDAYKNLKEEQVEVESIYSTLQSFNPNSKQKQFINDKSDERKLVPLEDNTQLNNIARQMSSERVNDKPQFKNICKPQKAVEDQFQFVNPKRTDSSKNVEKPDPMVWDPPSPKVKKPSKVPKWTAPVHKPKENKQVVSKPSAPVKGDSNRNYAKPWQQELPHKPTKENSKDNVTQPKSEFLESVYPNGSGPDAEIISMMEREIVDRNPNVLFDDIAELNDAKNALKEAVLLPILFPDFYKGIRRPWKGVMLFGPPGTGKTMLAKALATMGKTTFFNVSAASLASKWRGESEKMVRILFQMARFYGPSTIFFDEMDALFSKSDGDHEASSRIRAELLVQMDGVSEVSSASANDKADPNDLKKRVMVLAATNRPWSLDDALIRRLEKRIYIPLPTEIGRKKLFEINLKSINMGPDVDFKHLISKTENYSGADITVLCREASFMPMRRRLIGNNVEDLKNMTGITEEALNMDDFKCALVNIKPSVNINTLAQYGKWMSEFGSN